ncbi:oxidoreductase [Labilibaculum sp. K2S]|uniref:oxidoreductase n=1 Tax=Labilibaculum sp. K2S TaxID=3056386 RepID=UPI0025A3EC4E|nr:oxidoreductase [Labilibaculum sp. K2S]MDM8162173.1 oxidoreductase [Labilibaculum sp. K2S]
MTNTIAQQWIGENMQSQAGKTVLITGANSGIGYHMAEELGRLGARVWVTCRSAQKLEQTLQRLRSGVPAGNFDGGVLDLGSLQSVNTFAAEFLMKHDHLHILINNAGVMVPPPGRTAEGFEMQFGVNFLGHYALTGFLFTLLKNTSGSRVVTLSSISHKGGRIDFNNFRLEKPYDPWREYGQSKMADIMFAIELQHRIVSGGLNMLSLTAHPGVSKTGLQRNIDPRLIGQFDAMDALQGALPALMAATSDAVLGFDYFGPVGPGEINGLPGKAYVDPYAFSGDIGIRLWEFAAKTTGVEFP